MLLRPAPLVIAWLALLIGACAGRPPRDEPPAPLPILVHAGTTLAGFDLADRKPDPDPYVGTRLRYQSRSHDELRTDVFVYLAGIHPDADTAARDMAAAMGRDLQSASEQGLFEGLESLGERRHPASTRYGIQSGVHLRYALRRDGGEFISHAHLFYLPPYTVKFRSTFPAYGNTSFDAQIDELVSAFMADLAIDLSILCRRETTIHTSHHGVPWVSLDGHDIFAADPGAESAAALLATAFLRQSWHAQRCDDPVQR